ncbi:hypothetical protein MMC17_004070 [Xylographa soralifera]|nr:hypothetical protein [Xylographa soralifera]
MAHLTNAIFIGFFGLALYYVQAWLWRRSFAHRNGCKLPPRRKTGDPILGLYKRIQDFKSTKAFKSLPAGAALHSKLGHTFRETTLLGGTRLRTRDAENIHAIYGTNAAHWGVEPFRFSAMQPFMGEGFTTKDGPVWEYSRQLLKPSFYKNNISDLGAFEHSVRQVIAKIPRNGSIIDLQPLLLLLFVDTSTHFILGKSLGVLNVDQPSEGPVQGMEFLKAFQLSLRSCGLRLYLGPLRFLLPKSATSDQWQIVHRFVEYHIDKALQGGVEIKHDHRSLLHGVIQQTTDKLEIRSQIIQRHDCVAGHDPGTHQQHYSARVALIDTVLPTGGGFDGQSPVFAAVGTEILADFYALHRDESVYGPEVEDFKPDRWDTIKPGPWQYMAFGGGMRACLGQQKALAEASCFLIRMAQAFRKIESRDERDWAGDQKLVARNVNGCKVALIQA